VLFVASEAMPFSKTGGLADVAHALPKELRKHGVDARVMITKTFELNETQKEEEEKIAEFTVEVGWRNQYSGLSRLDHDDVPYYFIDNEYYFKRDELYGHYDDGEKFSYFSRAVLESIQHMEDFTPDIIHFNDWHTGVIPVLLKEHYAEREEYKDIKTVYTIHNLKYQGVFGHEVLGDLLNLDGKHYTEDSMEFYGGVNYMKGAINHADVITTVSPTYAHEIRQEFFGENLHGVLNRKSGILHGIVNGIDYELYNSNKDKKIPHNFNVKKLKGKKANKAYLQEKLGLPVNPDVPVIAMISRFAEMKGFDLLIGIFNELIDMDIQLVILGVGEHKYESTLSYYAGRYPDKFSLNLKFDSTLAHEIYASSDMFLMPSKFEPCGLSQQIAMRYGTVPIVRETGGLRDTVMPYNKFTQDGNGFSFGTYSAHEMLFAVKRALDVYPDKRKWNKIIRAAMKAENSWENSALKYKDLYKSVLEE